MKRIAAILLLLILASSAVRAAEGQTELTWLGHSAFRLVTPSGKVLLIDPWITNPSNPGGAAMLAEIGRVDYILVTHTHNDHLGNAVDIAKRTGAKLVATFGVRQALVSYGGFPVALATMEGLGDLGGMVKLLDGEVTVGFVPAVHGSTLDAAEGLAVPAKSLQYGGEPGGFWISVRNGPTIYDAGDTDVFSDMRNVNLFGPVDLMLVPIGDKFTMGPERAALAAKLVGPKMAAPMHYGTSPVFTGTATAFEAALSKTAPNVSMALMKVGQPLGFKSRPVIVAPRDE